MEEEYRKEEGRKRGRVERAEEEHSVKGKWRSGERCVRTERGTRTVVGGVAVGSNAVNPNGCVR